MREDNPIYLLNSLVYRTEQQNKLTFIGKTAFDSKGTNRLAEQYLSVAKEVEDILSLILDDDEEIETPSFFQEPWRAEASSLG